MIAHRDREIFLDMLEADARHDRLRFAECCRALLHRGWRVERCEPPRPERQPQAEPPPPAVGPMTPAAEQTYFQGRPRGHRTPGVS